MSRRLPLAKAYPKNIEFFVADINSNIKDLASLLRELFNVLKSRIIGGTVTENALKLFDGWLNLSLLPSVTETSKFIVQAFEGKVKGVKPDINYIKKVLVKGLPFEQKIVESFVEKIEALRASKGINLQEAVNNLVWELYDRQEEQFMTQSAHTVIGRFMLYLVGVDKRAFKLLSLPSATQEPYINFYWSLRREMAEFLPVVYVLSELDWWYFPDIYRQALTGQQKTLLINHEEKLDKALARIYGTLRNYDYANIDRDAWKEIYLTYLPEDEIRRLGFVPTPDEIVELILDLAGYDASKLELCKKILLDPACGSGTFLVEAALRLRRHLENDMPCHAELKKGAEWEYKKQLVEHMIERLWGIDIHPFATFLTSLNVSFQLLDLYSIVKHYFEDFTLNLHVITHDSLSEPKATTISPSENARVVEIQKRSREYAKVDKTQFDFVVGNPPWGGVLRGKLGPLGDEKTREAHRARFGKTATGKYDIYVPFIHRGLMWLKQSGTLGMITQITYLGSDFGKGITDYIDSNANVSYIIDLSDMGEIIFPHFTNYPCITIMEKTRTPSKDLMTYIKVEKRKSEV